MKQCSQCGVEKEHSVFCIDRRVKDGLSSQCKECHNLYGQSKKGRVYNKVATKKYRQTKKGKAAAYRATRIQQKKHPEKLREYAIKYNYNLSPTQYKAIWDNQEGLCAICKVQLSSLSLKAVHVDHDHSSGKVRGILCNCCNLGLGQFRDSILYLDAAKRYLMGVK